MTSMFDRKCLTVVITLLSLQILVKTYHRKCFLTLLARADICTGTTSGTIQGRNSHHELVLRHTCKRQCLCSFRSGSSLFLGHRDRADNCVRAHIRTEVTLDTVVRIPNRYIDCDTTFLVCSGTRRSCTIYIIGKCRYRQVVTLLSIDSSLNGVDKLNNVCSSSVA